MAIINMNPDYESGSEEVKPVVETGGEETIEQSSTQEETPDDKSESIEEATSEKTVEAPVVDAPKQEDDAEGKRIEALKLEEERLRKQISELRGERRQIKETQKSEPLIVSKPDDLSDVAASDVEVIEKVLRAKGYVRKDEIQTMSYSEKLDAYKNEWLAKHPEYLPENDPEDKKWDSLNSTVSAYFKAPTNPKDISKVLDLAHNMVSPAKSLPVKSIATTSAAKEKLDSSSKGSGGGVAKSAPSKSKIDPNMKQFLHGFSDDELKELIS